MAWSGSQGRGVPVNYFKLCFALIGAALTLIMGVPQSLSGMAVAEDAAATVEAAIAPDKFVSDLLDELRSINAGTDGGSDAALRDALLQKMAVSYLQGYLIAGDIKKAATDAQISEYDDNFSKYISAAIGGSIDRLVERRIDIGATIERRPGDFVVRSKVFSDAGEERAVLDWRIRDRRGKLFLTDFFVDGQSFVVERKAQFSVMVRNGGFETLLTHMNEVIAEAS
jgi:phospholipid transport system substrate-binding protein